MRTIKMLSRIKFVFIIAVLIIAVPAFAQVVFFDNFEDVNAITWPCWDPNDPNCDADPNAPVGTWELLESSYGVQVILNSIPGPYNGVNYLSVDRLADASGGTQAGGVFSQTVSGGNLTVTFALIHMSGYQEVTIRSATSTAVKLGIDPSGTITNYDFGLSGETGFICSPGEWHELRMAVNFSTKTYDLYFDGIKITGLGFNNPYVSEAERINFYNSLTALPARFYLDNLTVETGTPVCAEPLRADLNGDCKINMLDFAKLAGRWLECDMEPEDACWQ